MNGRTNAKNGGGAIRDGCAVLEVKAPINSQITATRADGLTKRQNKGFVDLSDNYYQFYYIIIQKFELSNFTWTINATDGINTASTTVTLSTEGEFKSIKLVYNLYLIHNGHFDLSSGYDYNITGGQSTTPIVTENYDGDNGKCVRLFCGTKTGNSRTNLYFTPKYTFPGDWKYMVCEYQARGHLDTDHNSSIPAFGAISQLNSSGGTNGTIFAVKQSILSGATDTLTTKTTEFISIESIPEQYWIGFSVAGSSSNTGEFLCYNLYLSKELPGTPLYMNGIDNTIITGGWDGHGMYSQSYFKKEATDMQINGYYGTVENPAIYTNSKIDLTNFSTLYYTTKASGTAQIGYAILITEEQVFTQATIEAQAAIRKPLQLTPYVDKIDISALSGSYYIGFNSTRSTSSTLTTVYSIWAE